MHRGIRKRLHHRLRKRPLPERPAARGQRPEAGNLFEKLLRVPIGKLPDPNQRSRRGVNHEAT